MKKILMIIAYIFIAGLATGQTFFQKNGSLSSDAINTDVDFNRATTDITIAEAGNYMILISAQGSTKSTPGNPFSCFQREGIVKVWSRTRNIELARTPINYIFADSDAQTVGNPPGLKQLTFPYYNIMVLPLNKGEIIGLKGYVSSNCTLAGESFPGGYGGY